MPSASLGTRYAIVLLRYLNCRLNGLRQCVRAYVHEARVFVAMVLILIFAEVLGLYGYVQSGIKVTI